MSKRELCVVCGAPVAAGRHSLWCRAAAVQGCPRDALTLCLMVQPKFLLDLGLRASGPWSCNVEAGSGVPEILQYTNTLRRATGSGLVGIHLSAASLHGVVGNAKPLVHCLTTWGSGCWGS